jgi:hypothetical protein
MRNKLLTLLFGICVYQHINAQDSIPLLTGTVKISIKKGTMECDLSLSNFPRTEDYLFRLNSGMNLRYTKSVDGGFVVDFERSLYDTLSTGESNAYYFPSNNNGKYLPKTVQFKYVGMYPVFMDTATDYASEDWKGNIAFNGNSVRADGFQTCWYPVLYDVKKDKIYDEVKYDLEISCEDCSVLHINGSVPASGTRARFKTEKPYTLTLFCGNFKYHNFDGTYILNPDIDEKQMAQFSSIVNSFRNYFEAHIGIPYKQAVTFIHTTPTSKQNAWMFAAYPSFFNIGHGKWGMKLFFGNDSLLRRVSIAHELGHYYFGTVRKFNSGLGDMMTEGFSEYLALKLTRSLIGEIVYKNKLQQKQNYLKKFLARPMASIRSRAEYENRELYVYHYAPLIFTAIEKEIGEEAMWKWIKNLLQSPTVFTDYKFMLATLEVSVTDKTKVEAVKRKYFESNTAAQNAATELGLNP